MSKAQTNEIEIEYESFGSITCEAMVLISGLGVQMTRWPVSFCEDLASKGYLVIRFDNRDIGYSTSFAHSGVPNLEDIARSVSIGAQPVVPYTLLDMVEDLAGLLDFLRIKHAHIVGRSMGGMIAQLFASRYPDRTLSLTSIMSSTGNPLLPPSTPEAMSTLTKRPPNPSDDTDGYIEHCINFSKVIGSPDFPTEESVLREQALAELQRSYTPSSFGRQIAAIAVTGDIRGCLNSIVAPTLVIHGKSDPLVPVECGEDSAANIKGSELWTIEGMGHDFPEQLHKSFAEAIVRNARRMRNLHL
ncbi:MAG: alpha/beta hydrolase [Desulfuromonadales bacterium]